MSVPTQRACLAITTSTCDMTHDHALRAVSDPRKDLGVWTNKALLLPGSYSTSDNVTNNFIQFPRTDLYNSTGQFLSWNVLLSIKYLEKIYTMNKGKRIVNIYWLFITLQELPLSILINCCLKEGIIIILFYKQGKWGSASKSGEGNKTQTLWL